LAKIEVPYFDGCATYRAAEDALRRVLAEEGTEAEVEPVAVDSDEEAGSEATLPRQPHHPGRRARPVSYPRAGGPAAGRPGCRVYATPEGLKGSPPRR